MKFGPRGEVSFDMMLGFQPILRNHGPDTYRNTQNLSENQCIFVREIGRASCRERVCAIV